MKAFPVSCPPILRAEKERVPVHLDIHQYTKDHSGHSLSCSPPSMHMKLLNHCVYNNILYIKCQGKPRKLEEYQEVIASNLEEINYMSKVLEDLFVLSKSDENQVNLDCKQFNLKPFILLLDNI